MSVELHKDLTDVPDPTFDDRFGTAYVAGGSMPNRPFCSFPNSVLDEDATPGRAQKTCLRHMTTDEFVDLDLGAEWKTFCLRWDRFSYPPFPPDSLSEIIPSVEEKKDRLIKVQFMAYQPPFDAAMTREDAVDFDFFIDDVYLLTEANWNMRCEQTNATEPDLPKIF